MPRKKITGSFDSEREKMHREMLSAVSHDLKTPLASVIGSLEVHSKLGSKLSPEKQQTLLRTALDEAYRLDNFITNILDMAKLENKMVKFKKEEINLRNSINDCIQRLGNKVNEAKIEIEGKDSIIIHSDPNMLCRAVYLITDNAIRHSGPDPEIKITFGKFSADKFFIRIADAGPGIPDNKIKDIFSKYTRIARQDHQNAGTGLGLAICRQIVTMLGGTVTAENLKENGKTGAAFEIILPA